MNVSRGICWMALLAAGMMIAWAAATPAAAQGLQGTPEERRACMPDVVRLCQDFVPDADKVNACLYRNKAELSTACRTVMLGHAPAGAAVPIPTASPVRLAKLRLEVRQRGADRRVQRKKPACSDDDDDDD